MSDTAGTRHLGFRGLGFRELGIEGLRFRGQGFRVYGLGLRIQAVSLTRGIQILKSLW